MTIRQQVQEEAQKAAAKIREAVEQFTQATGLEPSVDVLYVNHHAIQDAEPKLLLLVTVECGGVVARA